MRALCRSKALLFAAALIGASADPAAAIDTHRADVKSFIAQMADEYSFKKSQLRKLLAAAQTQPAILKRWSGPRRRPSCGTNTARYS